MTNTELGKYVSVFCAFLLCVSIPLSASAYFGDTETTLENIFGASSLGISLTLTDEADDYREYDVTPDEAEDVTYRLKKASANGAFCSNVNVVIKQNAVEVYNGALATFTQTSDSPLLLGDTETWTMNFSPINGNGVSGDCAVVWEFESRQSLYGYGQAFYDTESTMHTLSGDDLGVLPPPPTTGPLPTSNLVLNEIYPNEDNTLSAPNDQEWVEVYNGTGAPINVEGWKLGEYAGSSSVDTYHVISSANTCAASSKIGFARPYGGASTIVPPGGYLVLEFCAQSRMNNNGDTVGLFDTTDTMIDSYNYPATAKGKSNARIPDGGAWVDPIPTPGAPNQLEEEPPIIASFSFASEFVEDLEEPTDDAGEKDPEEGEDEEKTNEEDTKKQDPTAEVKKEEKKLEDDTEPAKENDDPDPSVE